MSSALCDRTRAALPATSHDQVPGVTYGVVILFYVYHYSCLLLTGVGWSVSDCGRVGEGGTGGV